MRDREKKLDEIFQRAERLRQRDSLRKKIALEAVGGATCAALLILLTATLPRLQQANLSEKVWKYGALLLSSDAGGYILVAALSMALGALMAMLCAHLRKLRRMDGKQRKP